MFLLIKGCVFIGTSVLVILTVNWLLKAFDRRTDSRMRTLTGGEKAARELPGNATGTLFDLTQLPKLPQLASHLVPNDTLTRKALQARLMQAGIYEPSALVIYFIVRLAAMVAPPVIGLILGMYDIVSWDWALLCGAIIGGFGLLAPTLWLQHKISRRQRVLRRSLPDFLDLFVVGVESGLTLNSMLGMVVEELREAHPELAGEFSICTRQMEFGNALEVATADLAERTGLDDLRSFNSYMQQAGKHGSSIGGALRELARTLRVQREQRAEELAQQASVKILLPTLLFIFPAIFVVVAAPAAIQIRESMSQTRVAVEESELK